MESKEPFAIYFIAVLSSLPMICYRILASADVWINYNFILPGALGSLFFDFERHSFL